MEGAEAGERGAELFGEVGGGWGCEALFFGGVCWAGGGSWSGGGSRRSGGGWFWGGGEDCEVLGGRDAWEGGGGEEVALEWRGGGRVDYEGGGGDGALGGGQSGVREVVMLIACMQFIGSRPSRAVENMTDGG